MLCRCLLTAQDRVDPLDRRHDDIGGAEHPRAGELVDVVELGEAAPVARRAVVLELPDGLLSEIVAVDEEEDPPEPAEVQQPVCRGDGCVGLARPRGRRRV